MSKYDKPSRPSSSKISFSTSTCVACSVTEAIIFAACLSPTSESFLDPLKKEKNVIRQGQYCNKKLNLF